MSGRYGTRFGFEFTPTPPGFEPVVGMLSAMMDRPLQPPAFTNPYAATLDSIEFAGLGMPPSEITLAEVLTRQGYHTAHIGKWHLGEENGMAPHDQGFAESLLMASGLYGRLDDEDIIQASREDFDALSHIELHPERVYAAMIRSLDRGVGRVLEALKANGLDENTLVIFTSDNGGAGYIGLPNVNAPYRGWKSTLFEGGIRVPFLARWPAGLPAGETFDAPVHHVDIYATAAAAAGADLPPDRIMDGVDLRPYVTQAASAWTCHMSTCIFRGGAAQAVRDKRWKLVVSAPPPPQVRS